MKQRKMKLGKFGVDVERSERYIPKKKRNDEDNNNSI